jgi:LacI family transcriptional regulator
MARRPQPPEMPVPYKRAKIGDVATALGLSVSTVSRALNGYDDVNAETRERIERQAREMGYRASAISLKLRKGKSRTAGFILPPTGYEFADPVFLAVLSGAEERLRERGIQLIITTSSGDENQLPALQRLIESDQVDSMILARLRPDDERVPYLLSRGIPMSLLGRSAAHPEVPSVEIDHAEGLRIAARHLHALGRRRLAHINVPLHYNFGLARRAAFKEMTARLGLAPRAQVEASGNMTEQGGHDLATAFLGRSVRPDAIICGNDAMAIGALYAIVRSGLQPGKDVSLIGSDDMPVSSLVNPPLTTLRIPFHQLGNRVAENLLLVLEGNSERCVAHNETPTLIVRAT